MKGTVTNMGKHYGITNPKTWTDDRLQELLKKFEGKHVEITIKEVDTFYQEMCKENGYDGPTKDEKCCEDGKPCDASGDEDTNFGCHIMS